MRGPVVQSLNVRQTCLRASGLPLSVSAGNCGYESTMRPRPTASIQPAHHGLGHLRQVVLQVRIARANHRQLGHRLLALPGGVDLPPHADQRILGRLVAVAGRKDGWPLDVRAIVGTAAGEVHGRDAPPPQTLQQCNRLGQVDPQRVAGIDAEGVQIRQAVGIVQRSSCFLAGLVRHGVEHAEPYADGQAPMRFPDTLDDRSQQPRATVEVAAVAARRVRALRNSCSR